ncbi:MAG: tetratricopeptide repeat protein [Nitrospirae bacterium]|nr:tetratricopeptide repeat protein [Nitrospirota bacterium]
MQIKYENSFCHKPVTHILLILLITLFAYSNTFYAPFQFDDNSNIVNFLPVKNFKSFIETLKNSPAEPSFTTFKSRFITYLTFALNYKLHGLNVTGYHVINFTIHIINTLLIYWLVVLTLQTAVRSKESGVRSEENIVSEPCLPAGRQAPNSQLQTNLIALFSSLLFVSHPVQTQAVTYIVQRFASLATLFYLLSLVMYVKFRTQNIDQRQKIFSLSSVFWYLTSVLSAVLAMKTKEIAFTLPIIIVLYEFFFFSKSQIHPSSVNRQPSTSRITRHMSRFLFLTPFLLTMLIIPLTLMGFDESAGNLLGDVSKATRIQTTMTRLDYLFTEFRVIVTYIRLLFFPVNQNLDYDYPIYNSFLNPNVFLSFLLLFGIFCFGVYLFYYSKKLSSFNLHPSTLRFTAFGIFWFFITLSVESSVIPIVDVIFEHRLYLPSIGLIIAFVCLVFYAFSRITHHASQITVLLLAAIVIALSIATYQRNIVWQDEIRLWEDVKSKSPGKERVYSNLGTAYKVHGLIDKALEQYQIALQLNPYSQISYCNLAIAYSDKGLFDKAIDYYLLSIKFKPDFPDAYYNLGNAYLSKGLTDKAIEQYQVAIKFNSNYSEAYNGLGAAYKSQGLTDKAIQQYQSAIKFNPDYSKAHYNLGKVYQSKGLTDKAIEHYKIAFKLDPDNEARQFISSIIQKNLEK